MLRVVEPVKMPDMSVCTRPGRQAAGGGREWGWGGYPAHQFLPPVGGSRNFSFCGGVGVCVWGWGGGGVGGVGGGSKKHEM